MRRDVEGALSFFEQRSRAKMVDQRRRRNKEVEQRPNEYLRQVSSQLALEAAALKGAYPDCDLMKTSSMDSATSLDEDLLVNTSGVLGLDPGNDALLFWQGSGAWTLDEFGLEPKGESTYSTPERCPEVEYPPEGFPVFTGDLPERCMGGVYASGGEGLAHSPFDVPSDVMYGMQMDECKPEFRHPVSGAEQSMSGVSMDVKGERVEVPAVDSLPQYQAVRSEFLTREKRSEMRESRRLPISVDLSALSGQTAQRVAGRSKGVTMCLRTLLRQLLAGTGWIMDSSISKDHATHLIRQLVGTELDNLLEIQLSPRKAEVMSSEDKEIHYSRILGELVTQYVGCSVTLHEAQELIKRDKGPYHLTQEFIDMLKGQQWPPHMIPEKELRKFGCYRQGEASKRSRHD